LKKQTTTLHFSETELKNEKVREAAQTAEKAADKADRAKARLPSKKQKTTSKLRGKKFSTEAAAEKLRHGKKEFVAEEIRRPPGMNKRMVMKGAAAEATVRLHREVGKYEDENVGVQAVNETEGMAEGAIQTVDHVRYGHKLKKYDKAVKLEKKADAANVEALFQKKMAEDPKAASNPISRWRQKQAIKKEYAAMKTGKSAGTTASTATGAAQAGTQGIAGAAGAAGGAAKAKGAESVTTKLTQYVAKHSHVLLIVGILALIIMVISASLSSCSVFLTGGSNVVIDTSFTAEDEDIKGAEEDYQAMEEALREQLADIEEDNPGYDEYRINADEVGHNPYQLAAFLTVLYEDYERDEVQGILRTLFNAQYDISTETSTETETETSTVRVGESLGEVVTSGYCNCVICCGRWSGGPTASGAYPTAEHTIAVDANNPFVPMGTHIVMNGIEYVVEDTGNFDRYGVQFDVYYDNHIAATLHGHKTWEAYLADDNGTNEVEVTRTVTKKILTVTLGNGDLGTVIANYGLSDDQWERYELLMKTKGNRSYLFADDIYANAGEYTDYDIPGEALTDERFANMIHEAEKYLGYPYVWGGSSPSTSFDCSGFVSYVINHCGNGWNYGRLTADGLKSICSIIPKSEAEPGDLIFFQGTYNTSGASHVGIYVGNGMMIHCGNPIQYTSIETSYWQSHFYCFGRLP